MDFLIFIAIVWWLFSKVSQGKKSAAAKRAHRRSDFPSPNVFDNEPAPKPAPAPVKQAAPKPAPKPAAAMGTAKSAPRAEMAPRVQTTVHVSEHDHSAMFEGSMAAHTGEGEDPHDHGQRPAPEMPSQYSDRIFTSGEEEATQSVQPGLDLGWDDRDSLVKAFVMQEVLTRPCDRRR